MATTQTGFNKPNENDRSGRVFTWTATILACAYLAWTAFSLYRTTAAFSDMYASMNLNLHGASWFVIHHYRWFYPSLFGGVAAALITKQFFIRAKWVSLTITLAATGVLEIAIRGIVWALYRPVREFAEKLK